MVIKHLLPIFFVFFVFENKKQFLKIGIKHTLNFNILTIFLRSIGKMVVPSLVALKDIPFNCTANLPFHSAMAVAEVR